MVFYSPLRYPGGKNKIRYYIGRIIKENHLTGGVYVEPFAGGASVALSLLINGVVSKIIINDFDRSIYAFWYCVLNFPDELCKLIRQTKISLENREKQKLVQRSKDTAGLIELGFSTLFLNRTNYSGVINGGPLGGSKQQGEWKLNSRFTKKKIIERIKLISKYRNKIELHNLDALDLLKIIERRKNKKIFLYLDPPYYVKGRKLYVNFYEHKDHVLVSKAIRGIKNGHWIVSYDNVKEIIKIYKNTKKIIYNLNYSIGPSSVGREVMFFDPSLSIPKFSGNKILAEN